MNILPLLTTLALSALALPAPAQQPDAPVTLHARARIVLVDVVVTDSAHHPIHGLTRDQFTLLEDHKTQSLRAFEEHTAPTAAQLANLPPLPKLPPGIFTNYVPAPPDSGPLNILLLDALNTPLTAQQYVRQQLLDYLKHQKPGTRVAVFGLSTQLVMLQGFTSDPNLLRQVLERQNGKGSILLDNVVGGEGITDSVSDLVASTQTPAPGAGLENVGPSLSDVVANLKTFEDINSAFQLELRIRYTLDALNQLARYLANIPGRKNLIWFSGSFPLNVLPSVEGSSDPFAAVHTNEDEYRETVSLLARSQAAVYPIDARGLETSPLFSAAQSGSRYGRNPSAFSRDLQRLSSTNIAEHQTMAAMANDTGGQAFYNTNGLSQAVSQVIDDGANYYTLAYTPTDARYSGDFRHIDVKLARQGLTLSYRRGYYADNPDAPPKSIAPSAAVTATGDPTLILGESLMQKAMQHGVPGATQIVYTVRALPDDNAPDTSTSLAKDNVANREGFLPIKPPYRRYSVGFGTDPSNIVFTQTPDGTYHGSVEYDCFLYQPDGQVLNSVSNRIVLTLTPARYAGLMKSGGISFQQEISAPAKGDFSLRTGVHDLTGNRIGSTEFPLSLVNNLAPLPAPPK
jgi:VWFA-related protein